MKILHLYYDIMNLYGEYANLLCLERYLKQQNISVETDKKSLGDDIDFSAYDFVYIGSGTENNQLISLEDIMKNREKIKNSIENGAVFLATGNSFELFGEKIVSPDNKEHKCLSFFPYYTVVNDKQRFLTDQVCSFTKTNQEAVGFINKASEIFGADEPMFNVIFGEGNNHCEKTEGYIKDYFFGTHLTGPCLMKNPFLAEYFVKLLCKKESAEFLGLTVPYETKAYEITLNELKNRFSK